MLEAFTLAGAIVAFANAVFTVWDRLLRGRPKASLTGALRTTGMPPEMYIRISNLGPTDVLIQSVRVRPAIYDVAKDHSAKGRKAFFEGVDLNLLLRSGKEHDLPIIDLRNAEDVRKNVARRVCFFIHWRKTSSSWLWQPPVWCMTSTRDIQRIRAASAP
jgi:hypothetical protein